MQEVWKDVLGYEGLYQVSNYGNVRSIKRQGSNGNYLKQRIDKNGYKCVVLCKHNSLKNFFVHRLVATAFIENKNAYPCVNHKDENKENNEVNNLEWCTVRYNNLYNGLIIRKIQKRQKNRLNRMAGVING